MGAYILKKLSYGLLVIIGVIVVVFFLFQGLGDPARMAMGQSGDKKTQENIRRENYLDKPKWQQFVLYLNDVLPIGIHSKEEITSKNLKGLFIGGDKKLGIKLPYLRKSYQSKRSVAEVLWQAVPGTILLAFTAMFIAIIIGIPLGILSAIKQNTWLDTTAITASIIGISVPSFFMGILLAYVFGFLLHPYTGLNISGNWFDIDEVTGQRVPALKNLILPAVTLGIRPMAIIAQITRSAMLDVLGQDYIRTAYAKGLSSRAVVWKHGLRNALNPVVTTITGWLGELLAGAFFVEYIFGWQGIGKITVEGLDKLDYPLVMGAVLFSAFIFVTVNILSDILYGIIDPRISIK